MELIKTANPLKTALSRAQGKIGKLGWNSNKFATDEFLIHDGHRAQVQILRDAGCDTIILELVNLEYFDTKCRGFAKVPYAQAEQMINDSDIVVDYVVYLSPSEKPWFDNQTSRTLTTSRIDQEDYKGKLALTDRQYDTLINSLTWATSRFESGIGGFTTVRSLKNGAEAFAVKHYLSTYCDVECIIAPLVFHPGTKVVQSSTGIALEHMKDHWKNFCTKFYNANNLSQAVTAASSEGA